LSWQVVPENWETLFISLPPDKLQKVMHAMFQMKKLDIKTLEEAGK
jgi:predicted 3-demethylubiquinone-9 3-methyltransferase (glyoxalase superfamily)